MPDFSDHSYILQELKKSQDADHDNREAAREADLFVNKRDGQWEAGRWADNDNKPRYTFDMTNPVIDQVAGEMAQADFDIRVMPAGGDATKETAKLFDGLIRNIENISNAVHIFNHAGRSMVTSGIDGWRVAQKFNDSDSFDQDLMILPISNFKDRVWFDVGSELQDRSDSRMCWVMQGFTPEEYKRKWPKGSAMSVTSDTTTDAYFHKPDLIMVGEFYYIKEVKRELVRMNNGRVYAVDDDFNKVVDELAAAGVEEKDRRTRKQNVVFTRQFDGSDWLNKEKETVFEFIPVIPTYGNFKIVENKIIYWGVVEKLLDPQRVLNYSLSREVEEGSLAPRAKYFMTEAQAAGHEASLQTLNTNSDPVQFFNADPGNPGPPKQNGGAQINPGLRTMSEAMKQMIGQTGGFHAANTGDNPGLQSGVAIRQLQNKGDIGTIKYFKSQEIAICHTARILVKAIPKVYETERQVRILGEDGSFDISTLNQQVLDQESQEIVTLNDLSQGTYDQTCSSGPAFQNRQQETVAAMTELAQVDPSIISTGSDILLSNITAPGMDLLAERKRAQLIQANQIPFEQMTDEEKQAAQAAAQAAQQNPQQDPNVMIGQAELIKAQNEEARTQVDVQEKTVKLQLEQQRITLDERRIAIEEQKLKSGVVQNQQKIDNKQTVDTVSADQNQQKIDMQAILQRIQTQDQHIQQQSETLKTLREAMGVDVFAGPHTTEAFVNEAVAVTESQERAVMDTSIGEDVAGTDDQ